MVPGMILGPLLGTCAMGEGHKPLYCCLAVNESSAYRAKVALHYSSAKYESRSFPAMDYPDR
jgi:hypothetical protein